MHEKLLKEYKANESAAKAFYKRIYENSKVYEDEESFHKDILE
jgi:hypothetical protein